jgi:predicted RNA binding protein YcfA (HicA-like mRNA interferase family)
MRTPRDVTGASLCKALGAVYAYAFVRQTGSHLMIQTIQMGKHSLSIPNHAPLKVGTLNTILKEVADHFEIDKQEVFLALFT